MQYVYALLDPDTKDVRYIGRTGNLELRKSQYLRLSGALCGSPLANWFEQLRALNKLPEFVIMATISGYAEGWAAKAAERRLIEMYAGHNDGHLILNLSLNPRAPKKTYWSRRPKSPSACTA